MVGVPVGRRVFGALVTGGVCVGSVWRGTRDCDQGLLEEEAASPGEGVTVREVPWKQPDHRACER